MKKKLLTVALAATMVISSAISALAATKDSVTIEGFGADNTGEETLSGDFDVTYTFHNKSTGTTNWDNYVVEIHTVDENPVWITLRADRYGWGVSDLKPDWAGEAPTDDDWAAFNADMKAGMDCTVNIVRKGDVFTVKMDDGGKYSFTATASPAEFSGKDVIVWLSGEKCELTNVKFANNTNAAPAAPADQTPAEQPTEKPADKPVQTGDNSAAVAIAIVALGAAAVVVALRKKVTA